MLDCIETLVARAQKDQQDVTAKYYASAASVPGSTVEHQDAQKAKTAPVPCSRDIECESRNVRGVAVTVWSSTPNEPGCDRDPKKSFGTAECAGATR